MRIWILVFLLGYALMPCVAQAQDASVATVTLGGEVLLRIRSDAGGVTALQRADVITQRLAEDVATPGITPADVAVLTEPGTPPVIFALGRRLITVDAGMAQATGGGDPMVLATRWAKHLQQLLPRANWRPSNAPDTIVPANPPLLVTPYLGLVGGDTGAVTLNGHVVIHLQGIQPGDQTAAERADQVTGRLVEILIHFSQSDSSTLPVTLTPNADGTITVALGGLTVVNITPLDALLAGATSPQDRAERWAHGLRVALNPAAK